jgi:predicted amidohydrolase
MEDMDICAAQYCSIAGDLRANMARHGQLMRQAARHGVKFLLFPELSLTGYEPTLARDLAQTSDVPLLQPLRELANQLEVTTVVGLPVRQTGNDAIMIGALVLGSGGSQALYTKQHLHSGEGAVFSPGTGGALVKIGDEPIALSICADFTRASHAQSAAQVGAAVYATSVLISDNGYPHDSELLASYARQHSLGVLMANHGGPSGGWSCAGRSAYWAPGGRLVVSAAGKGDCLVIARRRGGVWQGQAIDCSKSF